MISGSKVEGLGRSHTVFIPGIQHGKAGNQEDEMKIAKTPEDVCLKGKCQNRDSIKHRFGSALIPSF